MLCINFNLMRLPFIKKLGLGFRLDQEREIFSLVFLSYCYILLFTLVVILPPLAGLFSDEFYFWFPYVPIALSL